MTPEQLKRIDAWLHCNSMAVVPAVRALRIAYDNQLQELRRLRKSEQKMHIVAWRQKIGDKWFYSDGPMDPREVHDNGKPCEPVYGVKS